MNTLPMMITPKWLRANKACAGDYATFCAEWPEGMAMNTTNFNRASALRLNLGWFAKIVIPQSVMDGYDDKRRALYNEYEAEEVLLKNEYDVKHTPIRDEYKEKLAPIISDYHDKLAPITAEHQTECDKLGIDYWKETGPAWDKHQLRHNPVFDKYEAIRAPIDADYNAKCALTKSEYKIAFSSLTKKYQDKCDPLLIDFIKEYYASKGKVLQES